jgi:hypothetical protein
MIKLYAHATRWLCAQGAARWLVLAAFLSSLPSLEMGLQGDDYILRQQIMERGPFAAYVFSARDPQVSRERALENRSAGRAPWWADEHTRSRFFRPLASLSLWLGFAHGAPPWWMHLENCAIYALIVGLAIALYRQLGLSGAGLGWACVFFGLDGAHAVSVGWIAGRNTLLATCFGLACILFHVRARASGRPLPFALAWVCFALALLSGEFGLCSLGYLAAHAWAVDRGPTMRRLMALSPYAVLTGLYLAGYVAAGYGVNNGHLYRDIPSAPGAALLAFLESIPVWLASTATVPFAGLRLIAPGVRVPILVLSLLILALLVPRVARQLKQDPVARMLTIGALLSLAPLAAVIPQERLRFFVAFGVYGLLAPWVVSEFDAPERLRRGLARLVWRMHGVWLPLLFVPFLFASTMVGGPSAAAALDDALPRAAAPIAILLNPPVWSVPWYQAAMRAARDETGPPTFALYAGMQPLELKRVDDRTLELHAARSWFATAFDRIGAPLRAGTRIALPAFTVDVSEADATGAPTRVRFTFDRSLNHPGLSFWLWKRSQLTRWSPPPAGSQLRLPAASSF